ncbi:MULTISPECIES: hypothetical protein [Streptomyces]|uniref:Uncharacterized protein n=1 Tax=Streptomyces caniscabiei TaxID=2746961 RepID=A0ABU4N5X2_9ACTN|nr:hypothetical protein [Streptomyces caniscabiei]MBE4741597.1 hypothetical protein [Streptomyces caniscabiei]MBE4761981.1 hypothetical protein [Streptomyces caniscabiei]MBE4775245.1 hypothetical protein [Streptomyces caniscabiei]MBE4790373.1 hypothetical protein [Streptomyces caniscabiei]MBE4799636.1 hypothetical protein [Streptomyces caniscabiei]
MSRFSEMLPPPAGRRRGLAALREWNSYPPTGGGQGWRSVWLLFPGSQFSIWIRLLLCASCGSHLGG